MEDFLDSFLLLMSSASLMFANLTRASADVCRVNKRGNCFLYLMLVAPLYLQIMHGFGNNFCLPSPDLRTFLVLLNFDVPSPSDYLLAMFELIKQKKLFVNIPNAHHVYLTQKMVVYICSVVHVCFLHHISV